MKTLDLEAASGSLAEYARRLDGKPVVVTCNGQPIAALVPIDGMDLESLSVGTSPDFLDLIERARRRRKAAGTVSEDEIRREFGLPANGQE
jgi:antitoxin (DNA-binding transcriptional repressor) of toxin-antitoxin stability system